MLERYREQAIAAVQRVVGDAAEAEDCVQEAMLRLAQRGDLDPARVRSLLTRAALHIAIDRHRSRQRAERALERMRDQVADVVSPEQIVSDRAEAARVRAAIDVLPRRERQVMLLRLSGLSVLETAKLLGLSYKSVEGAYTRARAHVRAALMGGLAWLLDRMRRVAVPRDQAIVAAAALLFFASPAWLHRGPDGAASPPAVANAPATLRATSVDTASTPGADASHGRAGHDQPASDVRANAARGGGPGRQHQPPPTIVGTGPLTVEGPNGGNGKPPLIYFGGVSVTGSPEPDPIGAFEACIENGGPNLKVGGYGGGCAN